MAKDFFIAAAVCVALLDVRAQEPAKPKFEVVSIKDCRPGDPASPSTSSPGRLSLSCWPLWRLIADAYETFSTGKVDPLKLLVTMPLEGTPNWANSALYTIEASAESAQSGAMMRGPMMQALLEDRFHVKVHRETREVSGYLMTVDRGGLKLKRSEEGSCERIDPTDLSQSPKEVPCNMPQTKTTGPITVFDMRGVTLDSFTRILHPDGRPVFDRTGLTAAFDIHFEWETDAPNVDASSDPSRHASQMDAMRRQLGLRLDPGKGTRELLVIDRVEKPTVN